MDSISNIIAEVLEINGLGAFAGCKQLEQYSRLYSEVRSANEKFNLTAITDPTEFAVRHIADSLSAAEFIPPHSTLLAVGCGAGFPSLPLAIARPDINITALDSTAKKTAFVSRTASILSIDRLTAVCDRAENAAHGPLRESFQVVISRAVARFNILAELCIPLVCLDGMFIAMKGERSAKEASTASGWIGPLGGSLPETNDFILKGEASDLSRCILISRKVRKSPEEYPREFSKIRRHPLS